MEKITGRVIELARCYGAGTVAEYMRHLQDYAERLTREAILADLGPLLGLPASSVSLRQLSAELDEPHASAMLDQREQLHTVVAELQRLHRDHAMLLRDSLAFVDNALLFLESMMASGSTYQQTGEVRAPRQGRFLSGRV